MKILLLLFISISLYSQDTIYFQEYSNAIEFSDSINLPNGYPRQNTVTFQDVEYDSINDLYFHTINKVSVKGLEQNTGDWIPCLKANIDDTLLYLEKYYVVIQSHYTAAHWTPDIVPALFKLISLDECPEWIQPTGAHDAYNIGNCITFEGNEYESLIDANVWSPAVYSAGWSVN